MKFHCAGCGKMNQKGQIKIQQMAFMLMAITLFFVLVGIAVLVIRFSGLKQSSQILEQENAMLLVSKLANSPEFSCGEAFVSQINCIDFDKVILLSNNKDYENFWGVASIEIRKIYPNNGEKKCTSDNYETCGIIEILSRQVPSLPAASNFVTLCTKLPSEGGTYDKCEIAKLIVSAEDKTQ